MQPSASNTVLLVSSDAMLRLHLAETLRGLRWTIQEASTGAEAWMRQETQPSGAVLLDNWLPDLSPGEFAHQFLSRFPAIEMLSMQGVPYVQAVRSPRRNELLLALRKADGRRDDPAERLEATGAAPPGPISPQTPPVHPGRQESQSPPLAAVDASPPGEGMYALPDLLGRSAAVREMARLIRLAAPHTVNVLIEGETGTGKELVARAVHRLSGRSAKPFLTLNCAAIPEQLLEAELFGHTRGAFTGAVTSRTGRIEAAHGGTLFLDEIGEMPLALQAKMLRFLECGEIQRIGDNETLRVDVRIVAATHQPLEQHSEQGLFRLDLYHRLAVFPVAVPALRERMDDLPLLVQQTLARLGEQMPQRVMDEEAMDLLCRHPWPGNVRELLHVVHRAVILSGEQPVIRAEHIRLRRSPAR